MYIDVYNVQVGEPVAFDTLQSMGDTYYSLVRQQSWGDAETETDIVPVPQASSPAILHGMVQIINPQTTALDDSAIRKSPLQLLYTWLGNPATDAFDDSGIAVFVPETGLGDLNASRDAPLAPLSSYPSHTHFQMVDPLLSMT